MTILVEMDDLLAAGEAILGCPAVVRDVGALEAAVHRPRATVFGADAYPSLDHQAAAHMLSVVQNHALADGNKRLGLVAVVVFYGLNGRRLVAPHEEIFELTMAVADGSQTDVETVAQLLGSWAR